MDRRERHVRGVSRFPPSSPEPAAICLSDRRLTRLSPLQGSRAFDAAYILGVATDAVLITLCWRSPHSGLAIIFGLIGVINMGHGAMLTLGAYFTWWVTRHGIPFVPAVLLAAAGVGLIGLAPRAPGDPPFLCRAVRDSAADLGLLLGRDRNHQARLRHRLPQCRQPARRHTIDLGAPASGLSHARGGVLALLLVRLALVSSAPGSASRSAPWSRTVRPRACSASMSAGSTSRCSRPVRFSPGSPGA